MKLIFLILFLFACSTNTEQASKLTLIASSSVKDYHNAYRLAFCSETSNPQGLIDEVTGTIKMDFDNPLESGSHWGFTLGSRVDTIVHLQIYYNNKLIVDYSGFPEIVEFELDLSKGTSVISVERMRQ